MANPRLGFCDLVYLSGCARFNVKEDKTAWDAVGSPALAVTPSAFGAELGDARRQPVPLLSRSGSWPAGSSAATISKGSGLPATGRLNQEEREMISTPNRMAAIFVDRTCTDHWIVRDPEGNFWIVPPVEDAWESRQPFQLKEETELEAIPGHYRSMLGLPF
jgi:hypothetical protein